MNNWKYADSTNKVVGRTLENGGCESCLVEAITDWVAEGNTPEPYVAPATTTEHIIEAIAELFDRTAQSKGYDNRITCALRAGYPGPFHAEGQAFATWMDNCNEVAYSMLVKVEARTMEMPETIESALSMLPSIVWP